MVDYTLELESVPGRIQSEEVLVLTHSDGRVERMRLHDYDDVYAVPGLYEEVVQRRLECRSPATVVDGLLAAAADAGQAPEELRVLEVGAGNGVVAEELAARRVGTVVGLDSAPFARAAAERDRPGLFAEYMVGDIAELERVPAAIREHGLNALVAVGALGMGHISAPSFARAWAEFPAGAWLAVTLPEQSAEPGSSDFADYLRDEEAAGRFDEHSRERFRHRLLMDGSEVFYVAIVGSRASR